MYNNTYSSSLYHHGVKGQKWGVRRYQNEDGSLTKSGRRRLDKDEGIKKSTTKLAEKDAKRLVDAKMFYGSGAGTRRKLLNAELTTRNSELKNYETALNRATEHVDAKSAKKATKERKNKGYY